MKFVCEITIGDDTNKALVQKLQMKAAMIGFETTMLLRSHPVIAISSLEFMHLITRAVLRLECSLDCISGSVGHQQNIFIFSLSALLLKLKKCNYKKCNWVSGSPSILYKLVLSPVPIVHTNFQGNLLMSYSWCPQLSR